MEHKQAIALNLQHTVEQVAAASLLCVGQGCPLYTARRPGSPSSGSGSGLRKSTPKQRHGQCRAGGKTASRAGLLIDDVQGRRRCGRFLPVMKHPASWYSLCGIEGLGLAVLVGLSLLVDVLHGSRGYGSDVLPVMGTF